MTIGENIKRIRLQRGLTQAELGCLIGISESAMRGYELGLRNVKYQRLESIAAALGVNIEVITNSDKDDATAMQRLFKLFRQYDGCFDQNGNLQFQKLDLSFFKIRWNIYQKELAAAKQIKDEQLRQNAIEEAEDKFNWWMDTYNFPANNSQDILGGVYIGTDSSWDTKKMILEQEKLKQIQKQIQKEHLREERLKTNEKNIFRLVQEC